MPLAKSPAKQALRHNISEMVGAGRPPKQAVAAAYRTQRDARKKSKR
jgi:hypothetical protein